ncbi:hypothetical protein ANN_26602, partial [Periplaneta americana]
MGRACSTYGRNAYRVLVGRPEGIRPLGRPRRKWEDNIKIDLREVGYDDREWINLAQVQDNRECMELNGLHQFLVYADDVTILEENPQTIRENTEILLEASKEIGVKVNPEKTNYMIMSRDQNSVKQNISKIRLNVTEALWKLFQTTEVLQEEKWTSDVRQNLKMFEQELLRSMKSDGWDGSEDENVVQWSFAGALFYSIIVITTI